MLRPIPVQPGKPPAPANTVQKTCGILSRLIETRPITTSLKQIQKALDASGIDRTAGAVFVAHLLSNSLQINSTEIAAAWPELRGAIQPVPGQ